MTVLIIASTKDPASIKIKESLLLQSNWEEIDKFYEKPVYKNKKMKNIILVTTTKRKIKHENIDKEIETKLRIKTKQIIFISRHDSKTGLPSLTTHPIGNYGKAEYGGKNKTLCKSSPRLMTELLRKINNNAIKAETYHKICFEVTHHGPFVNTPSLFVEVGSNLEEWNKKEPANIIAKSVLDLLKNYQYEKDFPNDIPVLIGLGGGHYAPRFTDIVLEKKCAFGHMIPAYQIKNDNINDEILEKTLKETPNVKFAYIHRKSLRKPQVRKYKKIFEDKGIKVISSKELEDL